jgi:hypothetical protein
MMENIPELDFKAYRSFCLTPHSNKVCHNGKFFTTHSQSKESCIVYTRKKPISQIFICEMGLVIELLKVALKQFYQLLRTSR